MAERVVAATLVERWPADGNLPPILARLVKHAPDAFYDLRFGRIVAACRKLAAAGKPIHEFAVGTALGDDRGGLSEISGQEMRLAVAESEAQTVWRFYASRRLAQELAAGAEAITARPDSFEQVRASIVETAESLTAEPGETLADRLRARLFNPDNPPPEPEARFSLGGIQIATPGNLTAISAAVKAGKSAFIGAMLASVFTQDPDADCFGITSSNPDGLALVHLDTEQSPYDHHQLVVRARRRANAPGTPPWLFSHCLTGLGHADCREALRFVLKDAADRCGWIHSVLIDGVADLVRDVNDPGESGDFVAELHGLAITYHCPIVGVLHLNPGSDTKTRGHLGSQLERKAETNLRLEKTDEITVAWSDKNRGAPIPKAFGPCFCWSDADRMHVSTESKAVAKEDKRRADLRVLAEEVFTEAKAPCLSWKEFCEGVVSITGMSPRTAQGKLASMQALGVLEKNTIGQWKLA